MTKYRIVKSSCVLIAMMAAGCGDVSSIIADAARTSAKERIEETVDEIIDDTVGDIVDLDDLGLPIDLNRNSRG